jgi:DNA gyrase subunit B
LSDWFAKPIAMPSECSDVDHNDKTKDGIILRSWFEAVRLRPGMYVGADNTGRSTPALLLRAVLDTVACDTPPPQEIRALLWRDQAVTVAFDGTPLPIDPFRATAEAVPHPALYHLFLQYGVAPFGRSVPFGPFLNALSERLIVSTMRDSRRYRVVFSKGMVVTLLAHATCDRPLGTTWLTYRPDATIIAGEPLTAADAETIAERIRQGAKGVRILVEDHMNEDADWH